MRGWNEVSRYDIAKGKGVPPKEHDKEEVPIHRERKLPAPPRLLNEEGVTFSLQVKKPYSARVYIGFIRDLHQGQSINDKVPTYSLSLETDEGIEIANLFNKIIELKYTIGNSETIVHDLLVQDISMNKDLNTEITLLAISGKWVEP